MFQIIQEAELPKLTQTSLYIRFDETSGITDAIKNEIKNAAKYIIKPDSLQEIMSLIKLNGDNIAKKSVNAFNNGDIIIIFNKETSKIPISLPYLINQGKAYIFADKLIDNIRSPQEYTKLMALMEAAYLALLLNKSPNTFINNRQLMLTLCNLYMLMVITPLEQKLYIKGENLNKSMLYVIAYFYRMIDGENMDINTIPYKRLMMDKIDNGIVKTIFEDVKNMENTDFMELIKRIININPVRYKDLDTMYMSYFTTTCGASIIFALENLGYLFLLISSSAYKTTITSYALNKIVNMVNKKAITLLLSLGNK